MLNQRLKLPERQWQTSFSFGAVAGAVLICAIVLGCAAAWQYGPDRTPLPPRTATLRFEPLAIDARKVAPLKLAGAWQMRADDPRFGGLSALAMDGGRLIALSDSGAVLRFALPSGSSTSTRIEVSDLPDGPGSPSVKKNRDSEALARDPQGRGWWVAFEFHHVLWRYDPSFRRGARMIDLGPKRWPRNLGVEAMLVDGDRIILLPEGGKEVVEVGAGRATVSPLLGSDSRIADMARLPGGEILVLLRAVGVTGFRNQLGLLVKKPDGWRIERRVTLGVGRLANLEGLAVQPRVGGGARLWLVTDDNFQPPQTTMLIALDTPPGEWPGRRPKQRRWLRLS